MIEIISARGNTSLESAVELTKSIRLDIQELGIRIEQAASSNEENRQRGPKSKSVAHPRQEAELKSIERDIADLLERIDDAVPLINLAITTSGVSLSAGMPHSVSPSRLLQASTFLSAGDSYYAQFPRKTCPIGPVFTVSIYMLFLGHASKIRDKESLRTTIWKEVIHKARVQLVRVPISQLQHFPFETSGQKHGNQETNEAADAERPSLHIPGALPNEFAYQLSIIEDLEDDRAHSFEEDDAQPERVGDVAKAGIREAVSIHQVSKIFYADTGKLLNIGSEGESNNPILLLKRDVNAPPPRRFMEREAYGSMWDDESIDSSMLNDETIKDIRSRDNDGHVQAEKSSLDAQSETDSIRDHQTDDTKPEKTQKWTLPAGLDPEWLAFEIYSEEADSDSDTLSDTEETEISSRPRSSRQDSIEPGFSSALSKLHLNSSSPNIPAQSRKPNSSLLTNPPAVKTSLSLLEMLVRLTSLQQFQQASHLTIPDELLNFFLEESSTTGAAPGDVDARKRIRLDARQRVGFDPYDESPIKRRGEAYQHQPAVDMNAIEYGNGAVDDRWLHSVEMGDNAAGSPLYLRSREHSSENGTPSRPSPSSVRSTPSISSSSSAIHGSTPLLPGAKDGSHGPATPPSTTKSRQAFLREEACKGRNSAQGRSSPLSLGRSASPEKVHDK